jgi:hypothetical protein
MNLLLKDQQQLIDTAGHLPAVSLIMPFHPIMSARKDLEYQLKKGVEKIESSLMQQYPVDQAVLVLEKLRAAIRTLNYYTHKKSVAIFVSPLVEKVYYLDIALEENIVIDDSFDIRDLVYSKKQEIMYLVLLLSASESRMYLGNCSSFLLIKSNVPHNAHAFDYDAPEKVGNFSDPVAYRELQLDKFLFHMDQGLSWILKAYPFPVFVLGAEKVLGHFRQITRHEKNIVGFVHGNFLDATESTIRTAMEPHLADWQKVRQTHLLNRLGAAADERKLSAGIREALKASACKNSRLLLVEKGYSETTHGNNPFYIKDAVDDVIEKVLSGGGDVEFVEDGALKAYDHIALIRYY